MASSRLTRMRQGSSASKDNASPEPSDMIKSATNPGRKSDMRWDFSDLQDPEAGDFGIPEKEAWASSRKLKSGVTASCLVELFKLNGNSKYNRFF